MTILIVIQFKQACFLETGFTFLPFTKNTKTDLFAAVFDIVRR